MVHPNLLHRLAMDFATRLVDARKQRGLTQQDLADRVGIHVTQVRRYEAGTSAPTLDVLRNIAISLTVSIDSLAFGENERGPDEDLALAFEATRQLDAGDKAHIRALLEGIILRHQARHLRLTS